MKLPQIRFSKKILIPIIIIVIIISAAWLIIPRFTAVGYTPEEIITQAVDNLQNTAAISYTTVSSLTVNEQTREYGNICGEFLQSGDFRIEGSILGSNLEMYQLGNTTYRRDNISGNWQKTEEAPEIYDTALFNETNPLQQFEFSDFTAAEKQSCDEKNTLCVSFCPTMKSDSVSKYFDNLTYTIFCDKNCHLKKAVITGDLTNNSVSGRLQIVTTFQELPQDYQIEPPIVE